MLRAKRLVILVLTAIGMVVVGPVGNPTAHADLQQCPYPATGLQVRVLPVFGEAVGYICNYPLESNLSHLHAELGSYSLGGSLGLQGGAGGFGGVSIGVGLSIWSQSWRCPDERYIAAPPNGIGRWRDTLDWHGVKCPAVARAPLALDAPWPPVDPNIVFVVNQILPPGAPDPTAAPPSPAPDVPPAEAPAPNVPDIPLPLPSPGG